MSLPNITFLRGEGGIGSPLPGEDHVSGLLYYNNTLPSGFGASDRIKQVFSLDEAEALGIVEGSADHDIEWYHIREFFRLNPKGILYIGYYAVPGTPATHTFGEVTIMQRFAEGRIRQLGVYYAPHVAGVTTGVIDELESEAAAMFLEYSPLSIIYQPDIAGVTDLSTLANLRTRNAKWVSTCIGEDGGAKGAALAATHSFSIGILGAVLGKMSAMQVHQSIGWVKSGPVSSGELDVAAFGNGQLVKNLAPSLLDTLNTNGYIFLRKIKGRAGSFFNGAPTNVAITSDFNYQERNRVIDKAVRLVYARLAAEINSPVLVDPVSGKLSNRYIKYLQAEGDAALQQLAQDGEVSGYQTIVNPDQNVLSTGKIVASIQIVPVGVARALEVPINFTTQLSAQ